MPKIFTVRGICPNENNNFEYYYQLMSIVRGHCAQEVTEANTLLNINSVTYKVKLLISGLTIFSVKTCLVHQITLNSQALQLGFGGLTPPFFLRA